MIRLVDKIVFSGADGRILIIPLVVLIWVLWGQAKDVVREIKKFWRCNKMYEVIYDYEDDVFFSTLKEKAETYEEAKRIAEDLKECSCYSNIQIVSMGVE